MDSQMRKINEFYPWDVESDLNHQFLLCLDNNAFSGEFILHEAIIKLLRDGHSVYIISTNHSRNHYEAILRKNAYDLKQLELTGRIVIHHVLVGDDQAKAAWMKLVAWQSIGMPFPFPPEGIARDESKPQFSVVVDDLDAFEMLAPTAREGRMFLCKLIQSLSSFMHKELSSIHNSECEVSTSNVTEKMDITSRETKRLHQHNTLSVVAYGRQMSLESPEKYPLFPGSIRVSCASSTRNDLEPSLTEYCRYRCDVCVCVQALSSGYSSEVHGLFTVTVTETARNSSRKSRNDPGLMRKVVHYKALDTGVKCCMSNSV